ncbi:MAG: hypothetical protein MI725_16835 [Pirellulales bacterium]|nr:hypothetical protein [Pirellulales bacterium]
MVLLLIGLSHLKIGGGYVIKSLSQLAAELVRPVRLLRISVALGKRVESVERNPSCNRVL